MSAGSSDPKPVLFQASFLFEPRTTRSAQRGSARVLLLAAAVLFGYALANLWPRGDSLAANANFSQENTRPSFPSDTSHGPSPEASPESFPDRHGTHIARPEGAPRVPTGQKDPLGREVTVSCSSCHANLPAGLDTRHGHELTRFHQGLHTAHGGLACLTCHDRRDYDRLQLADASPLDFSDVKALCSQCHAPQARDFARGAHGGIQGHWDDRFGPRTQKNCIDCHDAHAPAFPRMRPTFFPRDRFLEPHHE